MNLLKRWLIFFKGAVKNQRKYFIIAIMFSIIGTLVASLTVLITGEIMNLVQQNTVEIIQNKVIMLILGLMGAYAIKIIINLINSNILLKSKYKLKKYSSKIYVDILNKMDYLNMSKSDYRKSLDIINGELIDNKCISDFMMLFTSLFSSIVSFFIIGSYTINFDIVLFLILLLIFILSLSTGIIRSKIYINKRNSMMQDIRKENYLSSLFDALNISREFFFFPIKNLLFKKWENKYKSNNKKLIKEKNRGEIFNVLSILLVLSLVFSYLFISLQNKDNNLFGTFFIVLLSILNVSNNVMHLGLICNRFYISSKNLSEIDNLEKEFKTQNYINKKERSNLITFNSVSFKYVDEMILENINLTINKGEKIGIVGVNGCGKSTLIKLLCGLYKPFEGEISVFGQNCYDNLMLKQDIPISIVMQDFSIYSGYTVEENILLGKSKIDYENYSNLGSIRSILEKKDLLVGERFGGTDLSKGQWQLLSILRAINADKEILILDEPTASLDPIVEKQIYEKFIETNKDKTIFVITHRLASVKNVDKILYIENGQIAECGSHKELISLENGKYKNLYNEQAKWYKEEK
jgi:ABC transporter